MSSSSSTNFSQKDLGTNVIEVEGGCTTNYVSNNDADDSVQPYEGKALTDEEWTSHDTKVRIVEKER